MHRGHSSTYSDSGRSSIDLDMEPERPKKRIRLNLSHMSLEEKIKRRKMKNREAAQLARDRKKAKMTDLEAATAAFAEERLKLNAENAAIRKEMLRLREENERLRKRMNQRTPVTGPSVRPDVDTESVTRTIESAELINASQPRTQVQDTKSEKQSGSSQSVVSPHWTMPFVCLLAVISNLTRSSTGCKSVPRNCSVNRSLMPQIMEEYEKEMQRMGISATDLSSLSRSWQTSGT